MEQLGGEHKGRTSSIRQAGAASYQIGAIFRRGIRPAHTYLSAGGHGERFVGPLRVHDASGHRDDPRGSTWPPRYS